MDVAISKHGGIFGFGILESHCYQELMDAHLSFENTCLVTIEEAYQLEVSSPLGIHTVLRKVKLALKLLWFNVQHSSG